MKTGFGQYLLFSSYLKQSEHALTSPWTACRTAEIFSQRRPGKQALRWGPLQLVPPCCIGVTQWRHFMAVKS